MIGRFSFVMIALACLLMSWSVGLDAASPARAAEVHGPTPQLFYNYYAPPGNYGGNPAQLYLSPRPTPPVVGHTYITYQPFMPHEYLYPHSRVYWRQSSNGGWTRTAVSWRKSWFDFGGLRLGSRPGLPATPSPLSPLLGTRRY